MRRTLFLLLLVACAPAHPGFATATPATATRRVVSRDVLSSELEAVRNGIDTGTHDGPFYVVRAEDRSYCLLSQREWTQVVVGEQTTCSWHFPKR